MKKTLLVALSAAFLAAPLMACDAMKGTESYEKIHGSGTKAELKTDKKAKVAKAKASKPVAAAVSGDKKI